MFAVACFFRERSDIGGRNGGRATKGEKSGDGPWELCTVTQPRSKLLSCGKAHNNNARSRPRRPRQGRGRERGRGRFGPDLPFFFFRIAFHPSHRGDRHRLRPFHVVARQPNQRGRRLGQPRVPAGGRRRRGKLATVQPTTPTKRDAVFSRHCAPAARKGPGWCPRGTRLLWCRSRGQDRVFEA